MKIKLILAILIVTFLIGCSGEPEVIVGPDDADDTTADVAPADTVADDTTDTTVDDTTTNTTTTDDTTPVDDTTDTTTDNTTAAGEYTIEVKEYSLVPKTQTIKVGETVVFKNVKPEGQRNSKAQLWNVRGCPSDFRSEYFMPGETYRYTFTEAGECNYREILQGDYAGKIIIE